MSSPTQVGDFFVRDVASHPKHFGLSVKKSGGLSNYLIERVDGLGFKLRGESEAIFASVAALIYAYATSPVGINGTSLRLTPLQLSALAPAAAVATADGCDGRTHGGTTAGMVYHHGFWHGVHAASTLAPATTTGDTKKGGAAVAVTFNSPRPVAIGEVAVHGARHVSVQASRSARSAAATPTNTMVAATNTAASERKTMAAATNTVAAAVATAVSELAAASAAEADPKSQAVATSNITIPELWEMAVAGAAENLPTHMSVTSLMKLLLTPTHPTADREKAALMLKSHARSDYGRQLIVGPQNINIARIVALLDETTPTADECDSATRRLDSVTICALLCNLAIATSTSSAADVRRTRV
jgi:hypothetical protein